MEQKTFSEIHLYLRNECNVSLPEDPKDFAKDLYASVGGHERANAYSEGTGFQHNPDQCINPRGYFTKYLCHLLSYLEVGEETHDTVMRFAAGEQWDGKNGWLKDTYGFEYCHYVRQGNDFSYYNQFFAETFKKN